MSALVVTYDDGEELRVEVPDSEALDAAEESLRGHHDLPALLDLWDEGLQRTVFVPMTRVKRVTVIP